MWGHEKVATYEPGSRFSPDTEFASTLILDFQASRKPLSLWCFVIAAQRAKDVIKVRILREEFILDYPGGP